MAEHAGELLTLMTWALSTLGGLIVAIAVWGGRKVLERMDRIEELLSEKFKETGEGLHDHDTRIRVIEERCHMAHGPSGYAPMTRSTGNGWDGNERRWSPGGSQ